MVLINNIRHIAAIGVLFVYLFFFILWPGWFFFLSVPSDFFEKDFRSRNYVENSVVYKMRTSSIVLIQKSDLSSCPNYSYATSYSYCYKVLCKTQKGNWFIVEIRPVKRDIFNFDDFPNFKIILDEKFYRLTVDDAKEMLLDRDKELYRKYFGDLPEA